MDERVNRLKTPESQEALIRRVKLRASEFAVEYNAKSTEEIEIIEAICAYEEGLTKKNGRKTRASRTWPMLGRHGIIGTAEL